MGGCQCRDMLRGEIRRRDKRFKSPAVGRPDISAVVDEWRNLDDEDPRGSLIRGICYAVPASLLVWVPLVIWWFTRG